MIVLVCFLNWVEEEMAGTEITLLTVEVIYIKTVTLHLWRRLSCEDVCVNVGRALGLQDWIEYCLYLQCLYIGEVRAIKHSLPLNRAVSWWKSRVRIPRRPSTYQFISPRPIILTVSSSTEHWPIEKGWRRQKKTFRLKINLRNSIIVIW